MSNEPQQSLEKAAEAKRPAVITTPAEFQDRIATWAKEHWNILSPFSNFTGLQEGYGLIASRVNIDPDLKHGEVYADVPWVPRGQVALAKVGLRKIAECAGISTVVNRTDPYTIANYWEVKAVARWRGIDGSIVEREAPFEWDMREGSPRVKGFQPKQIEEARKHGLRHCSTRAINAAIREYGVKQTYTLEEMAKPFVVLRVVYMPDRTDPEVRRILAENALAGTSQLYAQQHQALPAPRGEVIDALADDEPTREPRPVGRGPSTPVQSPAAASSLPEGFGLIQKVEREIKKRRDQSSTFTKFHVIDHTGTEHVTTRTETGEALDLCWKKGTAVDIDSAENDHDELEIVGFLKHEAGAAQGSSLPRPDQL